MSCAPVTTPRLRQPWVLQVWSRREWILSYETRIRSNLHHSMQRREKEFCLFFEKKVIKWRQETSKNMKEKMSPLPYS